MPDKHTAILVHGGAGRAPEDKAAAERRREGCRAAARAGWEVLKKGGSALDAVEAAALVLEDNPEFNAGTGSVLNRDGTVETDAAIMDGATLAAGAVGAVSGVRNPIRLARTVMEKSKHVMLAGAGAEAFADANGIARCAPEELIVPARRKRWETSHGTIGAVARDTHGGLAAATSTGGIFMKLPGRIGDTPLVGCGTYADVNAAVSATGDGEAVIRLTLARLAAFEVAAGKTASEAAEAAIARLASSGLGEAALIVVDSQGRLGFARNTPALARAGISATDEFADA
ncbi:MAG: isoaspartyl peptidase/L-asparaginase family protein [Gammaproteobacteria bacterium]